MLLSSPPSLLLLLTLTLTASISAETGITTRYWDCCKPSCAWPGKAQVSEPVRTCNKEDQWPFSAGFSGLNAGLGSGSTGGGLNAGVGSGSTGGGLNAGLGSGSTGGGLNAGLGSGSTGGGLNAGLGSGSTGSGLNAGLMLDPNTKSSCDGGDAYACSNMGPWAVNDNLAYGFAAAKLNGKSEWDWCCACYELKFTSTSLWGKTMIIQVINTGGDLNNNHFDLAIPGGGVGWFPQGCAKQFDGKWMGNQYGGYTDRSQCDILPKGMFRDGCRFRFDWFHNADNPSVDFKEVSCPQALIDRSHCGRWS